MTTIIPVNRYTSGTVTVGTRTNGRERLLNRYAMPVSLCEYNYGFTYHQFNRCIHVVAQYKFMYPDIIHPLTWTSPADYPWYEPCKPATEFEAPGHMMHKYIPVLCNYFHAARFYKWVGVQKQAGVDLPTCMGVDSMAGYSYKTVAPVQGSGVLYMKDNNGNFIEVGVLH